MPRSNSAALRRLTVLTVLAACGAAFGQPAPAPTTSPAPTPPAAPTTAAPARGKTIEKVPSAAEIQAKFVEATGGKAKFEAIKMRLIKGTVEMTWLNTKGALTLYQAVGHKFRQSLDIPDFGKVEQGSDGETFWEKSPMGTRIVRGEERAALQRSTNLRNELELSDTYPLMDSIPGEKIGDRETYQLILISADANTVNRFYDRETGLLLRQTRTIKVPGGDLAMEANLEDYRDVQGIKTAFVTRERPVPAAYKDRLQIITLESIEYFDAVDDAKFALPPEIVKLKAKLNGDDDDTGATDAKPGAPADPASPASPKPGAAPAPAPSPKP